MTLKEYYKGKKVFITGHTGFKGGWLTKWLLELGAIVSGVSLPKDNDEAMFFLLEFDKKISHYEFDILEKDKLEDAIRLESPEIIFHLAAQPIVIESYLKPFYTHSVNYLGTLNLLEVVRVSESCKKLIVITSDKVYKPQKNLTPMREESPLGGNDPYSASKSAVELLVASYRKSFFEKTNIDCLTARAGNVIGYGDWGKNRLLPDIFRSILNDQHLTIRNPGSIRPWQDINDLCYGYLLLCFNSDKLIKEEIHSMNFGPKISNITVSELVDICRKFYPTINIHTKSGDFQETNELILDTSLAREKMGWEVRVPIFESINVTLKQLNCHMMADIKGLEKLIVSSINNYLRI